MKITPTLAALSLFALAGMAFAADGAAQAADGPVVEACRQDVQTLCPGVKPGDGRIKACMKDNRRKLSTGCKSALKAQRAEHKAAAK